MPEFDLESFMEGVARDRSKERGTNDRIKRLLMNVKANQGTITLIPIISKKIGNIYTKIERVKEFNGSTSLLESGEAWYKILPIERYQGITPAQMELYNEVVSLYDTVRDSEYLDFDEIRVRNYSIFTGICTKQVDLDGVEVEDNVDNAVLCVYPSNSPIDALNTAIANKKSIVGPKIIDWLQRTITPSNTNRQGVLMITFQRGESAGYKSTVSFELNSEFNTVVDPKMVISKEILDKFDDPIKTFLGWCYDYDNKSYFNETVFRELRDNLRLKLKEIEEIEANEATEDPAKKIEETPVNKNGNVDPMTETKVPPVPVPGIDERDRKSVV